MTMKYICAECTSPDVQSLEWVLTNTEKGGKPPRTVELGGGVPYGDPSNPEHNYCNNCDKNVALLSYDLAPPPELPVTPQQFADYIWELCTVLNGGGDASVDPSKSAEVAMMTGFASFFSCAAEDQLWETDSEGRMAMDPDGESICTPAGLMIGLYERVRRVVIERSKQQ